MQLDLTHEDQERAKETLVLRQTLAKSISRKIGNGEELDAGYSGLTLTRRTAPIPPTSYLYEPSLAMIVQGSKRVIVGSSTYQYDESRFLLTAVNLPTITEVVDASVERPYLSTVIKLDLAVAKQLITDLDIEETSVSAGSGMAVGPATLPLFEALHRLIDLMDHPDDAKVLGELIQKELLYRVLTGPAGARLRHIVRLGTQSNRVARAIAWLRENFVSPLSIEDLAKRSGMGVSTLHHHFRDLTSMSPLRFQKHLRLHEARRLLLSEDIDSGIAALRVGYESATQFNREYRRLFGAPPIRDVKSLRQHATANLAEI